jgi:hypothetical protein
LTLFLQISIWSGAQQWSLVEMEEMYWNFPTFLGYHEQRIQSIRYQVRSTSRSVPVCVSQNLYFRVILNTTNFHKCGRNGPDEINIQIRIFRRNRTKLSSEITLNCRLWLQNQTSRKYAKPRRYKTTDEGKW